jgi:sugar lactone lactonase YvrE
MIRTATILAAVSLFVSVPLLGQGQGQARAPEVPPTDTMADDIPGVVRGGARIEVVIASVPGRGTPGVALQGTEGPIALSDGIMVFCETILGRIGRVEPDGRESVFVEAAVAGGPNGLTWDPKGRLIGATTAPGMNGLRVVYPRGSEAMLADNFDGKPFGRPNDLIADKKGGVYFTDPANIPNPPLPPAVYYLPPGGGKVIKVVDNVVPNGVTLSPDEKTFYVNAAGTGYVLAFDVQNDGRVTNRRNFARYEDLPVTDGKVVGGGDGFTVDTEGRLYTAAAGKVQVFSPKGTYLGSITPSRRPQNMAFAGPDLKTLYIVGGGSVFKVPTLAQGIKSRGGK